MPAPHLVFLHANGFPAGTYGRLFERWQAAGWRVSAPAMLGHDPTYPVVSNWRPTRDEVIHFIEALPREGRVSLVGHSLGGYLGLLVACRRPDLVDAVVLMDSPVLAGWRARSIRVAKAAGFIGRVSPARLSRRRRQHWSTADELRRHFASKRVFARWAPGVLDDYLRCGFVAEPGTAPGVEPGWRLAFDRAIETHLYNTIPHHLGAVLRRHPPPCPVGFVGGTQSTEVRQCGLEATRRVTRGRIEWIAGTHLFPMERPTEAADAVLRLLRP